MYVYIYICKVILNLVTLYPLLLSTGIPKITSCSLLEISI